MPPRARPLSPFSLALCRLTALALLAGCGGDGGGTSSAPTAPAPVPTTIGIAAGASQTARAGSAVAVSPAIQVRDQRGAVMPGVTVAFSVTAGDGSVASPSAVTDASGVATAGAWTLGPSPAVNRLEARVPSLVPLVIEARSWSVSVASVALRAVGDSQQVVAKLGADSTSQVTLSPITQSRWLQELPVTDSVVQARGLIRATGPGSIRLSVRAFGIVMDEVTATVVPPTPLIFSVTQPGWPADATIAVRGYGMNVLPAGTAVLVGTSTATRLSVDSAQLTVDPGLATTTQCVLSVTDSVSVPGVATLWTGTVKRPTAVVPPMAVGETRTLQGVSGCLRLPRNIGGAYALAQLDRGLMDRAVTTAEAYQDTVTVAPYTFSVGEAGSAIQDRSSIRSTIARGGAARTTDAVSVPAGRSGSVAAAATATDPLGRSTPWSLGEIFFAAGGNGGLGLTLTDIPWRVMRVYPNHVVFAISLADSAVLWTPAVIAKIDSAFGFVLGPPGLALYQSTFGDAPPLTSAGSGQYLVMMERRAQQGFAVCNGATHRSYFQFGSVLVGVAPPSGEGGLGNPPLSSVVRALAHEYGHSWDCVRTGMQGEARWGIEGLADFIAEEMERMFRGIGVADNVAYPADGSSPWWDLPYIGNFQNGYTESTSFMRQLAWRLSTMYNVSWEQARQVVILGSSEGWYGRGSQVGPGLVLRVRQIAGQQWDPVDARLDVVLSMAVDDRANGSAADYRFVALKETWRALEATNRPFTIAGWSFFRGRLVVGSGQRVSGSARADDDGYILIDDPNGLGSALELTSTDATLVWRLLRYR